MNNKGSALQIVLVLFMVLISTLSIACTSVSQSYSTYDDIDIVMKQKNLEIYLTRYYIDMIQNGFLMSDDISIENGEVSFTVDDMGNYSYIVTYITYLDIQYHFEMDIYHQTLEVKNFKYQDLI